MSAGRSTRCWTRAGGKADSSQTALRAHVADLERRLEAQRANLSAALDSPSQLAVRRERLACAKETYQSTYDRFARRSEEARIADQIAAADLRGWCVPGGARRVDRVRRSVYRRNHVRRGHAECPEKRAD